DPAHPFTISAAVYNKEKKIWEKPQLNAAQEEELVNIIQQIRGQGKRDIFAQGGSVLEVSSSGIYQKHDSKSGQRRVSKFIPVSTSTSINKTLKAASQFFGTLKPEQVKTPLELSPSERQLLDNLKGKGDFVIQVQVSSMPPSFRENKRQEKLYLDNLHA